MNSLPNGKRLKTGYDHFSTGFTQPQLTEAFYRLTADSRQAQLLSECASFDEIDDEYNPGEPMEADDMVMEAVRVKAFSRTAQTMAALARAMNAQMKDKGFTVGPAIIGKPRKNNLYATVTVQFEVSDGQVISIIFHSPDNNKMKIAADDEILAFRWLLNKRDITVAVSPEGEADISLVEVGRRVAMLIEKNAAHFAATQKDIVAAKKALKEIKAQVESATDENHTVLDTLAAQQEAEKRLDSDIEGARKRLAAQNDYNARLQEKLDALVAQNAGNKGKAQGEGAKTAEQIQVEQEQAAFDADAQGFVNDLKAMGFEPGTDGKSFRLRYLNMEIRRGGLPIAKEIETNYYVVDGKVFVNAAEKSFSAMVKNAGGAFGKALKALQDAKSSVKTVKEWMAQFGDISSQFPVGAKFKVKNAVGGFIDQPAIVTKHTDGVSNSFLPGVSMQIGDHTVMDYNYEELANALNSGEIEPWEEAEETKKQGKPEPNPSEPAAVGVLNDILAGKYVDSGSISAALDQAAAEIEAAGLMEKYEGLLNQAADYLTEILRKEAV